jgi:hypothetical protein
MRHRQAVGHDLIAGDINETALADACFAPRSCGVAPPGRAHITRDTRIHGHAVEVTPILRRERRDEGQCPDRTKVGGLVDGRQAPEQRVDKQRAARRKHAAIMGEDVAGVPGNLWDEHGIMALEALARRHDVLETIHSVETSQRERLMFKGYAETTLEHALGHAEAIGSRGADQEKFADLIGRHGQSHAAGVQPWGEPLGCVETIGRAGISSAFNAH